MNYEERYKQAIEAAKRELHCCGSLDCDAARQIFRLFPELKESEDERIRKEIIAYLDVQDVLAQGKDGDFKEWISWLEKQKPAEWSNGDDEILQRIISDCEQKYVLLPNEVDWLKSLKPNHWRPSEEQLSSLGRFIEGVYGCVDFTNIKSLYNDIKNL